MDALDRAADYERVQHSTALKHHAASSRLHLPSRQECVDCDIAIPAQRQALGGVERCIECEGYHQQEQRQRGFAL